jgi:hypothetical protein
MYTFQIFLCVHHRANPSLRRPFRADTSAIHPHDGRRLPLLPVRSPVHLHGPRAPALPVRPHRLSRMSAAGRRRARDPPRRRMEDARSAGSRCPFCFRTFANFPNVCDRSGHPPRRTTGMRRSARNWMLIGTATMLPLPGFPPSRPMVRPTILRPASEAGAVRRIAAPDVRRTDCVASSRRRCRRSVRRARTRVLG